MRESYYETMVSLDGEPPRDVLVILLRYGDELAGMLSAERIPDALALYAGLAVLAPKHCGTGMSMIPGDYLEGIARCSGLEFIYTLATLKHRGPQRYFEARGYKVIGFVPGYDREEVEPGVVKRVQEVVYAKVLVPETDLLLPSLENMTPTVRKMYEYMFPAGGAARTR